MSLDWCLCVGSESTLRACILMCLIDVDLMFAPFGSAVAPVFSLSVVFAVSRDRLAYRSWSSLRCGLRVHVDLARGSASLQCLNNALIISAQSSRLRLLSSGMLFCSILVLVEEHVWPKPSEELCAECIPFVHSYFWR